MWKFFCFIIGVYLCLNTVVLATNNILYLCIEGVSRETFFALLYKDRLPSIKALIGEGNFRRMTANGSLDKVARYQDLLLDYADSLNDEASDSNFTLFDLVKQVAPECRTMLLLSRASEQEQALLPSLNVGLANIDVLGDERYRSPSDISNEIRAFIDQSETPFVVMANFPSPAYIGHHFREGCQRYSDVIRRCDRALGALYRYLRNKQLLENTLIVITTDYAFKAKTAQLSSKVWIAASKKVYREENQRWIVASLGAVFGEKDFKTNLFLP
ncbi:MAG: alkaline phosphatase family protein [bacterium]